MSVEAVNENVALVKRAAVLISEQHNYHIVFLDTAAPWVLEELRAAWRRAAYYEQKYRDAGHCPGCTGHQ